MSTFLQWNCRGIRTSIEDLQTIAASKSPVIICLQETKLPPDAPFFLKGYTILRKDTDYTSVSHGGVLIAASHEIPVKQIPLRSELQAVAARVKLGQREVSVCSIYLPPGIDFPATQLGLLVSELPPPFLLLGDFNAHNMLWGCATSNTRGRQLERVINQENMCILNTGSPTHFSLPSGRQSALDLSFSSPELASLVDWSVSKDPMGSDHFPIFLGFIEGAILGTRTRRWNFRKADTHRFRAYLENFFTNMLGQPPLTVEQFSAVLRDAAFECIPLTSGKPHRPPVPWWTEECRTAIRCRRRAYKQFKRNSTETNLFAYRQARAACRRTIRQAKRKAWRDYVGKLNRCTPLSHVFAQIKRIEGKSASTPLPVLCMGGRELMDPVEVGNEFGNAFARRCRSLRDDQEFMQRKTSAEKRRVEFNTSEDLSYNKPFSSAELDTAIRSLRSVAEGPDRIHNDMFKLFPQVASDALLATLNVTWMAGQYPSAWREATVIPILKPGKTGSDPLHYRPISLTSCFCKLLEKMVNVRFTWFLESHRIFNNDQCGFRKHRSTVDHLTRLDTDVRCAFRERRHVGAIFFDVFAAYDTVWRHGILLKARQYGLRGQMGFFIQNFLTDRTFRVRIGNLYSNVFYQEEGIPQGSVMSVGLFALAINDVTDALPPIIKNSLFVDDVGIWTTSATAPSLSRQLQLAVNGLERWSSRNGLMFSSEKTVGVHFCRRRRKCPEPVVRLRGSPIPFQGKAKFLGVTFDNRLTYKAHLENLSEKCLKTLNCLKCVSRTSYGADRRTLMLLYRSLIRSKMDYACFVYDSASPSVKKRLDVIHNSAIRIATGAFRTTPTASLLVEANEPPLALRRRLLGQRYAHKLAQFPSHPTYRSVFSNRIRALFHGTQKNLPLAVRVKTFSDESGIKRRSIVQSEISDIPPWELVLPESDTSLARRPKTEKSAVEMSQLGLELIASYQDRVAVYTDGSKTESGVGCAFVIGTATRSFTLPSLASVFTSELVAIYKALCFLETCEETQYTIFTDSLSSIQAISNFNSDNDLIRKILRHTTFLSPAGKHITLCWIPSHVGLTGNEAADSAAKRATTKQCTRWVPIPATDTYPHISIHLHKEWQRHWSANTQSKLFTVKPEIGDWPTSSRQCRREEVALCRLRTGHTLATHRYLLCGDTRPLCRRCGSALSVRHVLVSCRRYARERREHFGVRQRVFTLADLIGRDSDMVGLVLSYLKTIGFTIIYEPG